MRALLSAGASTTAADASFLDMKTPLHKAAAQGHRDVCVALMEAGADPNACDAAGNSALDVLSLSAPSLSAEGVSGPRNKDSGGGGGTTEACSIVVLSSGGEEKDWGGVREALVRYGGCRKLGEAIGSGNGGGGGGGEGGRDSGAYSNSGASSSSGGREAAAAAALEQERAPPAPNRAGAIATPASASSKGQQQQQQLVDTPRSEHGSSSTSAGIPCSECLLPKVVMVRASCCGGLLCKPCVRDICARRHSCRRCRDTRDP